MNPLADHRMCIVLLAAGEASRFGSAKQVADVGGVAMVRHCAQNALRTGAPVVVVCGAHRQLVERELRDLDVTMIWNNDWQRGMGGSIARGVRAACARDPSLDAVVILLGDQPAVSTGDLLVLFDQHHARPDCIVASRADGILGPPSIFPRRFFGELATLPEQGGARHLLAQHAELVIAIELATAGIDIDSPADYAKFRASHTPA